VVDKKLQVKDKSNLNKIFESYISFQDLQTYLDYIVKDLKHLFAMIWQLCPPTFLGHIYKCWMFILLE
jgi:hypothetical protein